MANVMSDERLGIHHVMVLDNYPHNNGVAGGGIRIIGLEQFALPGPYIRLGVKNMDAKAWLAHAKKQPFEKIVWPAYDYGADGYKEDMRPNPDKKGKFVGWETTPEAKDMYDKIQKAKPEEAEAIFAEVRWRATEHMRGDMATRQGIGFNDAYGYCRRGWAFCTQSVDLAYSQTTGIGIQEIHDRWDIVPKAADRLGLDLAKPFEIRDPKGRTMAPGGFIWGTPAGDTTQVTYPIMSELERASAHFSPRYQAPTAQAKALQAELEKQGALIPIATALENGTLEWKTVNGRTESEALLNVVERSIYTAQENNAKFRGAGGKPSKLGIGCVVDYLRFGIRQITRP